MDTTKTGLDSVKDYYGKVLQTNQDLKTSACCSIDSMPLYIRDILKDVHPEVIEKFYGCGSPIPLELKGKTVLDLGSGSGRDCFVLSKLVGPKGRVIGVDMTEEQLRIANKHLNYHTTKFDLPKANTQFIQGYIEDLEGAGIETASVDVVISNCVINLSPNKQRVFDEIFRVLKPGGELYFSDVFASRRIPEELRKDEVLFGECLSGALYTEDFRRMMAASGCSDYRITATSKITLHNEEIKKKAGLIEFYSMTVRAFKLDLEDRCEDYGQTATYLGGIPESPNAFILDDHHVFERGKGLPVCGNTAAMLKQTRYGEYFRIHGDTETHFGLFDCGPTPKAALSSDAAPGACC